MRIGLISDTHGYLYGKVFDVFADVDYILHAGDVGNDTILDELRAIAPVHAVSGNVDLPPTAARPLKFSGVIGGIRICMTHGHLLDAARYNSSALKMFHDEDPRVIVHGHSHRAKNQQEGDVMIVNPGAACKPRFSDIASVAILEITTQDDLLCTFHKLAP